MRSVQITEGAIEITMTPEQLATITALAGIVESIGTWPVLSIVVLVVLGPWVVNAYTSFQHQRRFESVVKMYEDNVLLVQETQKLGTDYREQLVYTTQVVSDATNMARHNQYCPLVRKKTNPKDIDE